VKHRLTRDEEGVRPLRFSPRDSGSKFLNLAHLDHVELKAKLGGCRRCFHREELVCNFIGWVDEHRDPPRGRHKLFQELQAFGHAATRHKSGYACQVPPGMREALGEANPHRIGNVEHHNRDFSRCILCRPHRLRGSRDDKVGLRLNEFLGQLRQPLKSRRGGLAIDQDRAALNPPQLAQLIQHD
jgi:hypothetical protein